jgi:hypothetical protein
MLKGSDRVSGAGVCPMACLIHGGGLAEPRGPAAGPLKAERVG